MIALKYTVQRVKTAGQKPDLNYPNFLMKKNLTTAPMKKRKKKKNLMQTNMAGLS